MVRILTIAVFFICCAFTAMAQSGGHTLTGHVYDKRGAVVAGTYIMVEGTYMWCVSDEKGEFTLTGIPAGNIRLNVSHLGYVPQTLSLEIKTGTGRLDIELEENSLRIEQITVTAQASGDEMNTVWTIGSNALEHLQASNVSDLASLLPGGKTRNPDLTTSNVFSLRDGGSSSGNASFGTAVEVDGVRVGNNASFGAATGVETRNIAVTNIESVEVLTGVPSVEYGDLNSGVVKIKTRKGRSPWNVTAAVNPRTYQLSFSKGFALGKGRRGNKGDLNISGEATRATSKLTSPYTSYSRLGFGIVYSNTFRNVLRFEIGADGNIGGMDTKDDPDAYTGQRTTERGNVARAHTGLTWLLNRPWITNLKFDAAVNFNDNRSQAHLYYTYASEQPAVHATEQGYFVADKLPYTFFADRIVDSKELDLSASLKYEWSKDWGRVKNRLKAGVQWRATGNVGAGEYYEDPSLAPTGYRPRPYSDYPFMHNLSVYAEENLTIPVGHTKLQLMAGVRIENLFIEGAQYRDLTSFSPRFNARWQLGGKFAVRAGWGVTEKLPSYYVLYPRQEYRDVQTFGFSYNNNESSYIYHTQPYSLATNENLGWQRNQNSEVGVEMKFGETKISLVGYYNLTRRPYKYSESYTPYSYNILQLPAGYEIPANPQIRVDHQTGDVFLRGGDDQPWVQMDVKSADRTFVKTTRPDNGPDVTRGGVELAVDFPEIKPLRTTIRLDAAYAYTKSLDNSASYYYNAGWSHTSLPDRSYQYVGIYASGDGTSVVNGRISHSLDANLTAITHIPKARIVISCRLEMSLVKMSQNLSEYNGAEYAYNVSESGNAPVGGSIYSAGSYTAIRPVAYVDLDGTVHPFTDAEAADPEFAHLILKSGNAYSFARDGYKPYFSANISITKEIGDHVSLSFYANNFTNSRRFVTSRATGVAAIFTPNFYYGLTCRIKF